ncbi:Nose resistant to fluoxetine protein, partial [Daphnia magna]
PFSWTVNNLFPLDPDYGCMGQTWYLAVDMQLFVISPLIVYPLWRWKKPGLAWLAFIAVLCQASIFFVYARDDLSATLWVTRTY